MWNLTRKSRAVDEQDAVAFAGQEHGGRSAPAARANDDGVVVVVH
jgi:hypothetical protein